MFEKFPQIISEEICLSCKGCCCFNDVDSIWRPHVIDAKEFIEEANLDRNYYIRAVSDGNCIRCSFLNLEDHKCEIYLSRPIECRIYPFLIVKENNDINVSVHLSCPYIQTVLNNEKLDIIIDEVKKFFMKKQVKEFIRNAPSLVFDYSMYSNEIMSLFSLSL